MQKTLLLERMLLELEGLLVDLDVVVVDVVVDVVVQLQHIVGLLDVELLGWNCLWFSTGCGWRCSMSWSWFGSWSW